MAAPANNTNAAAAAAAGAPAPAAATSKLAERLSNPDIKIGIPARGVTAPVPIPAAATATATAKAADGGAGAAPLPGTPMSPLTQLDMAQHSDGGIFEPEVTPEQMAHVLRLQQVFAECDKDGNGYIDTKTELRFLIQKWYRPTDSEVSLFMSKFDTNKDNTISFDEYVEAMTAPARSAAGGKKLEIDAKLLAEIRADFNKKDRDHDGKLGMDDVRELVRARYVPPEYVVKRFQLALDKDGDGKISHHELADAYEEVQAHLLSYFEAQRPAHTRPGTQTHIARLSHLFAECDSTHTGFIDKRELQYLIQKWYQPTDADVNALVARLTALNKPAITLAEYLHVVSSHPDPKHKGKTWAIEPRLLGHIEQDWKAALARAGTPHLTPAQCAPIAKACFVAPPDVYDRFRAILDTNATGRISFQELVKAYDQLMADLPPTVADADAKVTAPVLAAVAARASLSAPVGSAEAKAAAGAAAPAADAAPPPAAAAAAVAPAAAAVAAPAAAAPTAAAAASK